MGPSIYRSLSVQNVCTMEISIVPECPVYTSFSAPWHSMADLFVKCSRKSVSSSPFPEGLPCMSTPIMAFGRLSRSHKSTANAPMSTGNTLEKERK